MLKVPVTVYYRFHSLKTDGKEVGKRLDYPPRMVRLSRTHLCPISSI